MLPTLTRSRFDNSSRSSTPPISPNLPARPKHGQTTGAHKTEEIGPGTNDLSSPAPLFLLPPSSTHGSCVTQTRLVQHSIPGVKQIHFFLNGTLLGTFAETVEGPHLAPSPGTKFSFFADRREARMQRASPNGGSGENRRPTPARNRREQYRIRGRNHP